MTITTRVTITKEDIIKRRDLLLKHDSELTYFHWIRSDEEIFKDIKNNLLENGGVWIGDNWISLNNPSDIIVEKGC